MSRLRTFDDADIRRQRLNHAVSDRYGRTWHPYLNEFVLKLAGEIKPDEAGSLTLLDYGCGKGGFIEAMAKLGLFSSIAGYDPAVDAYAAAPDRRYDIVTCLDVLDQVGKKFVPRVLDHIARHTAHTAVFACLTKPPAASGLKAHDASYWSERIGQRMRVVTTDLALVGIEGYERAVIAARPN